MQIVIAVINVHVIHVSKKFGRRTTFLVLCQLLSFQGQWLGAFSFSAANPVHSLISGSTYLSHNFGPCPVSLLLLQQQPFWKSKFNFFSEWRKEGNLFRKDCFIDGVTNSCSNGNASVWRNAKLYKWEIERNCMLLVVQPHLLCKAE